MTESAAATCNAFAQPMETARTGVSAGEMNPPTLLPMFMMPPAVPLRAPQWQSEAGERTLWKRVPDDFRHLC